LRFGLVVCDLVVRFVALLGLGAKRFAAATSRSYVRGRRRLETLSPVSVRAVARLSSASWRSAAAARHHSGSASSCELFGVA
jgi:hypothetical protein